MKTIEELREHFEARLVEEKEFASNVAKRFSGDGKRSGGGSPCESSAESYGMEAGRPEIA